MKTRNLVVFLMAVLVLLAAFGVGTAAPVRSQPAALTSSAVASDSISYQGRLADSSGAPLDGTYTMRFILYDADVGGTARWDSGFIEVPVSDGLFSVQLGISQENFDGQALWLSIIVEGETLSPRHEILPAPYAMSLRPGAVVVGDSIGSSDAVLSLHAPVAGVGLQVVANDSMAIQGSSTDSWGGYFQSSSDSAAGTGSPMPGGHNTCWWF